MGQLLRLLAGSWPARICWQSAPCAKGRASPRSPKEPESQLPAAPQQLRLLPGEEAHLLRQCRGSRSWCCREHGQISLRLEVSGASRDAGWEIPGFPTAQILCV